MSNFYTRTPSSTSRRFVVAESDGVDSATTAIVVAALPGGAGEAVLDEAVKESVYRGGPTTPAALHVLSFGSDQSAGPGHGEQGEARAIGVQLAEAGIAYRVYRSSGEPLDEIFDLIHLTQPELVAISVRRRSPVMKLFLGSVAQQLILQAPCPVLTVT